VGGTVYSGMKSVLSAVVCSLAVALAGACVVVDSQGHIVREEKRFTVSGRPSLQLTTFDGAIDIRPGEGRDVVVEIEKRGPTKEAVDRLQVEAKQDGNRIEVEVKRPAQDEAFFGIGHHMSPTAKLIVTMPRDGNVLARSGDGSIRIEGVRGRLELRTSDGSIRAREIGGDVLLETHDGSVVLDGLAGDLDLTTGDGSVTVSGKPGALKLKTGDGSITLRAEAGTVMKDDWSVSTGDGGVTLYLPSDFSAEIDAHTGDGTIRSELDVSASDSGERERRTLRGRIGSGGKLLKVRTSDGSIRLKVS
jgi:putative adhesin